MWNDRRERKLPSALLRGRPTNPAKHQPDSQTTATGKRVRVKPQLAGPRPTFTGAQSWIQRHRGDIDTVVQLLDLYPNLIQAEGLDPLWDFLQPMFLDKGLKTASKTENSKEENRQRKKSKGRNHHAHNHHAKSGQSNADGSNARYLYVCDTEASTEHSLPGKSTKDRIVAALSSCCYVRTNPELPASKADFTDVLNAVSTADAFLFLMNDASLSSWFCLHQLGIAIAYHVPIVAVREAGYNLPPNLPLEFDQLEIVQTSPGGGVTTPDVPRRQHGRSKSSETWSENRAKSESQSSGFHSDPEIAFRQPTQKTIRSLADEIRNCFQTSVLYVPNFHDSCIAKLCSRLSDHLGDIFLDVEISKTEKHQRCRDSQSTDSEASDRLPDIRGNAIFRTVPPHRGADDKHPERTPSSDGSHDPPDTPTSTEKSNNSPISPFVRLPPIPAPKSEEAPAPGELSPEDAKAAVTSTPSYTNLFISPPSSPFLQTRYLVFPDDPNGSTKPYLVAFPADVYGKESPAEESSPHLEGKFEDETDDRVDEIRFFNMDDEPSFDKINLDTREDATGEKSPFSTPSPSARKAHAPKANVAPGAGTPKNKGNPTAKGASTAAGNRPPKAAERSERFRSQNGKIRGIQLAERSKQSQVTPPAKKYLRNGSDTWTAAPGQLNPKKNIKMTKVTLQYGPKGKLANTLI